MVPCWTWLSLTISRSKVLDASCRGDVEDSMKHVIHLSHMRCIVLLSLRTQNIESLRVQMWSNWMATASEGSKSKAAYRVDNTYWLWLMRTFKVGRGAALLSDIWHARCVIQLQRHHPHIVSNWLLVLNKSFQISYSMIWWQCLIWKSSGGALYFVIIVGAWSRGVVCEISGVS